MNKPNPDPIPKGVPPPVDILGDDYTDFIEWSSEDEDEFLRVLGDSDDSGIVDEN